jgi:hypothetical protein
VPQGLLQGRDLAEPGAVLGLDESCLGVAAHKGRWHSPRATLRSRKWFSNSAHSSPVAVRCSANGRVVRRSAR